MASVVVTMSGDEAKLWKAHEKILQQLQRTEQGYKKTGAASEQSSKRGQDAAKAQARAEKERHTLLERGRRLTESLMTPQERFNKSIKEAIALKDKGAISTQTLQRRYKQLKEELRGATNETNQQNSLLDLAVTKVGAYATAAGAVGAAVGMIRAAWQQVIEEQQKGLDALKKNEDTGRALLQISDSPEQFQQMRAQSQQLSSQFGVDVATVERVMFSAVSEGFRDAVPEIIAANQVIAPESAAGVAGQIPALFQGQVGALEAVNLTLKAARDSRLDFEAIARALPQAAEGGAIAKASPEETLATLSVLASRFKSGDTAADRIKAFSSRVGIDERFQGQGIVQAFESVQGLSEADRKKFLGDSQELNAAFRILSEELPTIKQRIAEIKQERQAFASGGGILQNRIATATGDEQLTALRENNIATQKLEEAYRTGKGIEGATADAAVKSTERVLLESGNLGARTVNRFTGVGSITSRAAVAAGFDEQQASTAGAAAANNAFGVGGQLFQAFNILSKIAQKQDQAADKMLQAAERQNRKPGPSTEAARLQAGLAAQGS